MLNSHAVHKKVFLFKFRPGVNQHYIIIYTHIQEQLRAFFMTISMNSDIILTTHIDFFKKLLFENRFNSVHPNNSFSLNFKSNSNHSGDSFLQTFSFELSPEKTFEILTIDSEDGSSSVQFVLHEKIKNKSMIHFTETRKLFLHHGVKFLKCINSELDNGMTEPEFCNFIKYFIERFNDIIEKEDAESFNLMKEKLSLPISEMVEEDEFFNVLKWAKQIVNEPDCKWVELVTPDEMKRLNLILSLD